MYLTPENAKDYVGMKLYADRSIFHLQNEGLAEGDTPTIIEADKESDAE